MIESNALFAKIKDCQNRTQVLRGYLDYDDKKERLAEVSLELADSKIWDQPERAQKLGQERAALETVVLTIERLVQGLDDLTEILTLAVEEQDQDLFAEAASDLDGYLADLAKLEFQRMFSGAMDPNSAYLEIQSGSGGTEAQDWADMLLRMYLRWSESKGFKAEIIELSDGDVAGIKSATVRVAGAYAYGWLRTETGVHRLVRKSPFDSGSRRHTSFASIFISPELDDDIDIALDMSDVRVDTYRASGAGGQHVNKTDSAIRLTHQPSGIVVQCQNQRSQHKNKDQAIKQLKAKLYELEEQRRKSELQEIEDNKSDISWGSQIRSYVLDSARIKDLRTNIETSNTQAVLNGELDFFIEASLKQGL
ncbi:peptide chain release factor 2 [Pseudomonadales bacterium]|nr:peptide chain release factor 2 [Gammaproteobacteria bacterium]MDA0826683.1 peptide chain release factor 2 [Pseudomonadota bacterium]MDA7590934.1 peptide chain release factor 2 [Pseudomonadales bacterium]MBT5464446.1 peptide chain release factor 2 [Gammaproteobacteria bacterium]MBT6790956.1 peptide chain release factor 2 [Gammaproteobacteria bacterium]